MKKTLRRIFLSSIIKGSGNDLPLSDREKLMIKWFVKFELSIILVAVSWVTPGYAVYNHYYDYKNLKSTITELQTKKANAQTTKREDPVIQEYLEPRVSRSGEEEFNYLLKTNETFKNYINGISVRRNNPGNLVFANQPGATSCGRFACWDTIYGGFRALIKQIELDRSRDHTIESFFNKYAPSFENDTEKYIAGAEKLFTTTRKTKIKDLDTIKLAQYITFMEHSVAIVNI